MGLFRSNQQQRTIRTMHTERADTSNSDLQYKAKSKLIGAVVLAVLGVLILPFIFSNNEPVSPVTPAGQAPLVSPSNTAMGGAEGNIAISAAPGVLPTSENVDTGTDTESPTTAAGTVTASNTTAGTAIPQSIASSLANSSNDTTEITSTIAGGGQALTITDTTQNTSVNTPAATNKPKAEDSKRKTEDSKQKAEEKQVAQKAKPSHTIRDENRTDDGSIALALLEGKQPAKSVSAKTPTKVQTATGKYSVQVAAYSSADDARTQRDKLSAAGVSNTFVQSTVINGRQTYRLRVGPFTTQEAAQAALTRLRGLGYGGFITGN